MEMDDNSKKLGHLFQVSIFVSQKNRLKLKNKLTMICSPLDENSLEIFILLSWEHFVYERSPFKMKPYMQPKPNICP